MGSKKMKRKDKKEDATYVKWSNVYWVGVKPRILGGWTMSFAGDMDFG